MSVRSACAVLCLVVTSVGPAGAQSAVELNQAGWKSLEQGDAVRAGQLFADALAQRPNEPVLLFGAAVSAQAQGRPAEAKPRLQRALEVNPRFTPAALLLGEIVYREGDLDRAIKTYETALAHAPGNADLTARLDKWREEANVHSSFIERRQDRFRVLFEGRTDAPLAAQATETLNTAFWRIGQALGAYPSDPIQVMLYTEKQFRDITRAPEWSGGLYDGKIRLPVAGASRSPKLFETVLSHELTHAMVSSLAPPSSRNRRTVEVLRQPFVQPRRHAARRQRRDYGVGQLVAEDGLEQFRRTRRTRDRQSNLSVIETP